MAVLWDTCRALSVAEAARKRRCRSGLWRPRSSRCSAAPTFLCRLWRGCSPGLRPHRDVLSLIRGTAPVVELAALLGVANSMQHACWLKEALGGSSLPPLICQICFTQPQLLVLINSQPCPPGQALPAPVAISQGKGSAGWLTSSAGRAPAAARVRQAPQCIRPWCNRASY